MYETETDVRRVASDWHCGQWSALYSFASTGTIRNDLQHEVETIVRECEHRCADRDYATRLGSSDPEVLLEEARELLAYVTQPITSIWSAHGHTFLDSDGYGSCLTCGAEFELVHDDPEDPSHGAYVASNGDEASACQGLNAKHGEERDEDDPATCNCVLCAS